MTQRKKASGRMERKIDGAVRRVRRGVTSALRRNRSSRAGVTLRSESSAAPEAAPGWFGPADVSPDRVPLELKADLAICDPLIRQ